MSILVLHRLHNESQEALGKALGLSRQVTGHRLEGRSRFTADEIEMASTHYGVPIQVLYEGPAACLRFLPHNEAIALVSNIPADGDDAEHGGPSIVNCRHADAA